LVKVREDVVRRGDGSIDIPAWIDDLVGRHPHLDAAAIGAACTLVAGLDHRVQTHLERGIELAEMVGELHLDSASVCAALTYRPVREGVLTLERTRAVLGDDVAHLLEEVLRMATTSLLEMNNSRLQTTQRRDQADNVRRMLIAMIDDARVAVLKLSERVVALRAAKHDDEARQQRIGREAHLVFAPLANRLGIWQLKWELEDLALRYLAPDIYLGIARQLDGKRAEREQQIADLAGALENQLREGGIHATVYGRAKHIYSIWRKMRTKNVDLTRVYDVRALRVVVPDIAQCYAALGVIHTQWRHVPSEFDDYIAAPKENGYRSIHTAVIGPDGKTLEVQIRTRAMHEEAELGVCAHWAYKDGEAEARPYAEKMNWLRQVVEWREDVESARERYDGGRDLGEELSQLFRDERIFVSTPKGHVIDLLDGATPVDFAYRVHSEIGHRCRGALVDGVETPLNVPLATGQRVEILTGDSAAPPRYWLEEHLGFVRSARAREKIRDWHRARDPQRNEAEGRSLVVDLVQRMGAQEPDAGAWQQAAESLGCDDAETLCRAVGAGDRQTLDVIEALRLRVGPARQLALLSGPDPDDEWQCRIAIRADDRSGLLRDITDVLGQLGVSLLANTGRVDPESGLARLSLDIRGIGPRQLAIIIDRIAHIAGIRDVRADPI
jgi:GTP pyrophosphokinase